jgi:hypothetical protein
MNQRKQKPWMRYEQVFIWGTVIVTAFVVAVAITYRAMSWTWIHKELGDSEARGGGRLGATTHHEHLAQADRFIAECKTRIARQREIVATAYENGHPTVLPGPTTGAGGKPAFLREVPATNPRSAKKDGPGKDSENRSG